MEATLVQRAGLPYRGIDTGQLRGMNPARFVMNLGKVFRGLRQSLEILDDFQPEVCFVTGGYVCAPVIAACRLRGIPILIYLPDMKPGWAIQGMSKLAQRVAISFPAVASYFGGEYPQGKAVVTGYPVRAEMTDLAYNSVDRQEARTQLAQALDRPIQQDDKPLVLIFGGSQGARSINHAIWKRLRELLPEAHLLHVVGTRDWPLYEKMLPSLIDIPHFDERYHPVAYLYDEMIWALLAADVAVARAGASTLGEFPIARLPSLLVPLPFAGVNQVQNAEALAVQGAAQILADDTLDETLGDELRNLLADSGKRAQMEMALDKLAQPDAALKIAQELYKLAI